jgi:hypothetical protein
MGVELSDDLAHLIGGRECEVEEVGQGQRGDVENGFDLPGRLLPRLHRVGRQPQGLLRAQNPACWSAKILEITEDAT